MEFGVRIATPQVRIEVRDEGQRFPCIGRPTRTDTGTTVSA
jgi:hypothetical protein